MERKVCANCKHYNAAMSHCEKHDCFALDDDRCEDCDPKVITNGDKIRQGGDDELIDFADGIRRRMCHYCVYSEDKSCVDKAGNCWEGVRAWLNAPSESENNNE